MKIAVVQMHVGEDKLKNIAHAKSFIERAAAKAVDLVVLPEMFCCPYETKNFPIYAERDGGESFTQLASIAKEYAIYLVAGSMPEKDDEENVYNTSYVFNRHGENIAKHRKMHLFDIDVDGGQTFKESETLTPGNNVTVFNTEFGKIGLCICYDLRFPELARLMVDEGAEIIVVPAAFNMTTGPAHWEILFRNRALDNQVFMIGAAPARDKQASYISYGHSLVVSPWGDIVEKLDEKENLLIANLDRSLVKKVRKELPLLAHRRNDIYTISKQ
ncbi:carbon-nitrogen hydrolase family protein [Metabacillus malikii]|uniref:Amidohydrolase n=1 Tax=Metabacillus malikii TaxID=1504265 RepID=A0ABT9ZJE9_9BACI|nr:carbon-nitrogen hydrolase family protein [Metabacillus malikii]MDQ0232024.1 putative amidohydrolase [Metabacillus malikii]